MNKRKVFEMTNGNRTVQIHRDAEWAEFVVRLIVDGQAIPDADYFTDDREDAQATALRMLAGERIEGDKLGRWEE